MYKTINAGSDEDWATYLEDITRFSMLSMFPEASVKQFVSLEETESTE
jgi:hypothetical protein